MSGAPPPKPSAHAPVFGVAEWVHFGRYDLAEDLVQGLQRLGIRSLRTGVSWADYHRPSGREWYDWLIPMLGENFDLLPCVTYTPPSLGVFPSTAAPPRRPKAYADFLDGFVSDHGRWFDSIELWNEPNNVLDWDWRADPEWHAFAEMIGGAAYWMRHLGKRTVLGGMCPTDTNWLRLMAERGVLEQMDAIAVHAFPGTWSIGFLGWEREVAPVREALSSLGWRGEIWITECGYSTWRRDEPRQVEHLLEALSAPVPRMYWYSYKDLSPDVASQEGFHFDERHYHTGLVAFSGQPKLAARLLEQGGVERLRSFASTVSAPRVKPVREPMVVTGGCGFLGCNIADALANRGEQVVVLDNFSRPGSEENAAWLRGRHPNRIEIAPVDIRDRHSLDRLLVNARGVFHLAAQVAVTTSVTEPVQDFEINARGTLNLLEAVRRTRPAIPFIFASTNKVYGKLFSAEEIARDDHACAPVDPARADGIGEDTPLDLYSPYGCSKGAADQYVHDYARIYGLRTVVLRMSCIYGPRQFGTEDQGWIAHFIRQALQDEPITIYGDGRQVRDALYVDDAVAAWLAAADLIGRTGGKVFNLGGGRENTLSLRQMLRHIAASRGRAPQVRLAPMRPGDQDWYVTDFSRFNRATGWQPRTRLDDGLLRLNAWLQHRFGGLRTAVTATGAQA